MSLRKIVRWLTFGAVILGALGALPAYFALWDRSDLVYQSNTVEVPLPSTIPERLPNHLALVTVQNIGRQPSEKIMGNISVEGKFVTFEMAEPNPAYGEFDHWMEGQRLYFSCPRLAQGAYAVRFFVWYTGSGAVPKVELSDSRGAARNITSIDPQQLGLRRGSLVYLGGCITGGFLMMAAAITSRGFLRSIARLSRTAKN